jgi:hypothetical protein
VFVVAAWVGSKTLDVAVCVVDTQTPGPVPGASITIFQTQKTPFDGSIRHLPATEFLPDPDSPYTERHVADSQGYCSFPYRFWAAGTSGWFRQSGYVRTSGTWLLVTAPGRPDALVPLDRQSLRPRDINDTTPLFVTVVLNKAAQEN